MSKKKDGIMVILSSPSGAGKTTLVKLLSQNKNFHISVSHTTRKPRTNEIADKDYYFVNHEKFEYQQRQRERGVPGTDTGSNVQSYPKESSCAAGIGAGRLQY